MNKRLLTALAISVLVIVSIVLLRAPSGKSGDSSGDPKAATPKTADGKPDLSGVWEMKKDRPCPPGGCPDNQVVYQFFDIGWGLPGGLPYQPWARELVKQRKEQNGKDDPTSHCLPGGLVKLYTNPFRRKIIQTPGLVVILFERDATYRQIFTDGRPLPSEAEVPSFNGYSLGHWDGDTLIVETVGFKQGETDKEGLWLDRNGSPLTGDARITERFQRTNYGSLDVTVTVNDPKAYTEPWTVTLRQILTKDNGDLLDYICAENEKDAAHYVGN